MLIKRMIDSGANDLTTVFRPYRIDELIGHEVNKKFIRVGLKNYSLPHSMLFTGPAGCGKTTAARIISLGLNCETVKMSTDVPCLMCSSCISIMQQRSLDVIEINVGKSGGKDTVDQLTKNLNFAPFTCRHKVLIFDEAHKLTSAAQDLLLKEIEDGYSHVYFIFCTNQPEKLVEAFRSRTSIGTLHFGTLSEKSMIELLSNICEYEGIRYNKQVLDLIVEHAQGSPRSAIGVLKQVIDEGSWAEKNVKDFLRGMSDEEDPNVIELSKALLNGNFNLALDIFSKMRNISEELLRCSITGFFVGCLKRSKNLEEGEKLTKIIDIMIPSIFTTGSVAQHDFINRFYKVMLVIKKG